MDDRVLLLSSPVPAWIFHHSEAVRTFPPLGPLYLCSTLEEEGHQVEFLDLMARGMHKATLHDCLERFRPDVIGISVTLCNGSLAYVVAREVKRVCPEATIVFGGVYSTFCYEEVLTRSAADYVVLNEGEETLLELLRYLRTGQPPLGTINGLAFRDHATDRVAATAPRPPIRDLDRIPFPKRTRAVLEPYQNQASIITSRGCPAHCTFCAARRFWSKLRFRSVDNVLAELHEIRALIPEQDLLFADDSFTNNPSHVTRICNAMIHDGLDMRWSCSCRVDTATEDLFAVMYEAGCRQVLFGMESGDERVLRDICKGTDPDQIEQAVALARQAGFQVTCSYMVGHATDTRESVRKTVEFARRLEQTYGVTTSGYLNVPYPGTYQYEHAQQLGLDIQLSGIEDFVAHNPLKGTRSLPREIFQEFNFSVRRERLLQLIGPAAPEVVDGVTHSPETRRVTR